MVSIKELVAIHLFEITSAILILLVVISSIGALNPTNFVKTKSVNLEMGYLETLAASSDNANYKFEDYKDFKVIQTPGSNDFKTSYNDKNEMTNKYYGSDVSITTSGDDLNIIKS